MPPSAGSDFEAWPVLSGPEIVFWPVHQKSSANFGKSSANLIKTSIQHTREGSIRNEIKDFFVSESVSVPLT
jgi:hypothetical protein